ncbi:hypothetical protein [Stackebrandtia soli]|uniref:hypothetical protein n=1 Tax=Stackebrandtia soli TaxID=1892856 RepID=UPI0039EBC3F6
MSDPHGPLPEAETGAASAYRWIPIAAAGLPMPDAGRDVMALIDANPPGIGSARLIAKSGLTSAQVHKQLLALRASGFICGVNRPGRSGFEIHWVRTGATHPDWGTLAREVIAAVQDDESGLTLDDLSTMLGQTPTTIIHVLATLQESGHVVRTAPGAPLPAAPRQSRGSADEDAMAVSPLYGIVESIVTEAPVGLILPTVAALAGCPPAEAAQVLARLFADGRVGGVRFAGNTDLMLWLPREAYAIVQSIVDSVARHIEGATLGTILEDTGQPESHVAWQLEALRDHLLLDNLRLSPKDPELRWFLVRHTSRRQYRPRPAPAQALASVHENPGLNCPQLAKLLDCSPTYLSVQLRALRKAGHVRWDRGNGPTTWHPL